MLGDELFNGVIVIEAENEIELDVDCDGDNVDSKEAVFRGLLLFVFVEIILLVLEMEEDLLTDLHAESVREVVLVKEDEIVPVGVFENVGVLVSVLLDVWLLDTVDVVDVDSLEDTLFV
jgi:hypothetical protein